MSISHRTGQFPVSEFGVTRNQIIERAKSWLRPSVSYSQNSFHTNEYGIYRTDCSGYVSMAWGLPGIPSDRYGGLDTIGLVAVSVEIAAGQLLPGDILLRAEGTNLTRHVTLFSRWANPQHTMYWGFEQAGGSGTVHRTIAYPYEQAATSYHARQYLGINEGACL